MKTSYYAASTQQSIGTTFTVESQNSEMQNGPIPLHMLKNKASSPKSKRSNTISKSKRSSIQRSRVKSRSRQGQKSKL